MATGFKLRTFIASICALFLFCACFLFLFILSDGNSASAETQQYFSPEEYTASDYLIKSNGGVSSKTIQSFSEEVKAAKYNSLVSDLPSVIPLQYLESSEDYAYIGYMGREYGFYIYKCGDLFHVLLIDFIYDFDTGVAHSDLEQRICVKTILQQCFLRNGMPDGYMFTKYNEERDNLYLVNPRFISSVYNENSLNYGDTGYSKQTDDGVIINQFRLNYSSVSFAEASDYLKVVGNFLAYKVLDPACDALKLVGLGGVGSAIKFISSAVETGKDLYEIGKEKVFTANNENNISTNMSKTSQRNNAKIPQYSRQAGFSPDKENNLILSAENDSYAEFITVVNDSNHRTRFIQLCEFDIAIKRGTMSNMEYLTSADDNTSFRISDQKVLFDDQSPQFEIGSDFERKSVPVYMFPEGNQKIKFTPKYSGKYSFVVPLGAGISVNGKNGNTHDLKAGTAYTIELTNLLSSNLIGSLSCSVLSYSDNKDYSLSNGESCIIGYQPMSNSYRKITASDNSVKVGVLDENLEVIDAADENSAYCYFIAGKRYYFLIENGSDGNVSSKLDLSHLSVIRLGVEYAISDKAVEFINSGSAETCFKLQLSGSARSGANILDISGRSLSTTAEYIGETVVYTFMLGAYESCYIQYLNTDQNTSARIIVSPRRCRWFIDGEAVKGLNVRLFPSSVHTLQVQLSSDGVTYETADDLVIVTTETDYEFKNGELRIGKIEDSRQISVMPSIAKEFALVITVDRFITKIKLDHCGGTGYDGEISVILNRKISTRNIPMPTRDGYVFKGYCILSQAVVTSARKYITENMEGRVWDVDVKNATLYAHWQLKTYTLTLINGEDCDAYSYKFTLTYGAAIPQLEFAPQQDGFLFRGYFTEPNGRGVKYYESLGIMDHPEWCEENGYYCYYAEGIRYCQNETRWTLEQDLTLYADWELMRCVYYVPHIVDGEKMTSSELYLTHLETAFIIAPQITGAEFSHFLIDGAVVQGSSYSWTPFLVLDNDTGEIMPNETIEAIYTKNACVAEGTLVTLANGEQVPVESLSGEEELLVWNLQTGRFDSAPILFVDSDTAREFEVVKLSFSDGTAVKVISEHAFWDVELNEFVYLDRNAEKYVGHRFRKYSSNGGEFESGEAVLVGVEISRETVAAYSPVTAEHLCYYVNGMLSLPGGISGLFNLFEVDEETQKINAEAMARDVETYGLYTYEEFNSVFGVPEEIFNAFNGKYLKVAIGKGLISENGIKRLISRYEAFWQNGAFD